MSIKDASSIAEKFNEYINTRNIKGLSSMMTEGHTFIDTEGTVFKGKEKCKGIWGSFFEMFPDYRNVFESVKADDTIVTIAGYSSCSDERLSGPVLWTAKIVDNKIDEWRVYNDTAVNRQLLNIQ